VKAFIFERNGEPTDVLGIRDLPDPVPGPGDLHKEVANTCSCNRLES
jgi:NADPH:quinone reductase-like Zn-dependent oxidoreductase